MWPKCPDGSACDRSVHMRCACWQLRKLKRKMLTSYAQDRERNVSSFRKRARRKKEERSSRQVTVLLRDPPHQAATHGLWDGQLSCENQRRSWASSLGWLRGQGGQPGTRQSQEGDKTVMAQGLSEMVERHWMELMVGSNILGKLQRRQKGLKQDFKKKEIALGPARALLGAASGKTSQGR